MPLPVFKALPAMRRTLALSESTTARRNPEAPPHCLRANNFARGGIVSQNVEAAEMVRASS
jgi:hypothetical protein